MAQAPFEKLAGVLVASGRQRLQPQRFGAQLCAGWPFDTVTPFADTDTGKFGRITTKGVFENLVHVSSDTREARREIDLWFRKNELLIN